jgi:hypothetical protein
MNFKFYPGLLLMLVSGIGLSGCTKSYELPDAAFTGTWIVTTENGISGARSQETLTVSATGRQFRIDSHTEEADVATVYDGDMLYTKSAYTSHYGSPSDQSQAVGVDSYASNPSVSQHMEKSDEVKVANLRFWADLPVGKEQPGGQMAGHDVVHYMAGEKRPDGEISLQYWVDPKTRVVLKSIQTIFSSQVSSMVSQTTKECQQIDYHPLDPSVFNKP